MRRHVNLLLDAILLIPGSFQLHKSLARVGLHAVWSILRLLRRQGGKVERKEQPHGTGIGFTCGSCEQP